MNCYAPHIYINGTWKKVKTIIHNQTNMGPIPSNALLTSDGVPFLTKSKEYFLVDPTTTGLTATTSYDYIRKENLKYTPYIK